MSTQGCLDQHIKSVTDYGEGNIVFCALAFKRKNAFINGKVGRKTNKCLAIGTNELHLTRQTFLSRDLPVHPTLFPLSPSGQGERFEYRNGGITARDRPVERTEDLGPACTATAMKVSLLEWVMIQQRGILSCTKDARRFCGKDGLPPWASSIIRIDRRIAIFPMQPLRDPDLQDTCA